MRKSVFHGILGTFGTLTIASFLGSTLVAELFLPNSAVISVKYGIAHYGIYCLVAFMALTGISGNGLAKGYKGGLVGTKRKRMVVIALNGVLIMIPSALFLSHKASSGALDIYFYSVQVLETVVGSLQLFLMYKNFSEGRVLIKGR